MTIKIKIIKCKVCEKKMQLFNSLRPYCSPDCGAKYAVRLAENKKAKELNDKCKVWKVSTHSKEYKKEFQNNVNLLARMIDTHFGYETCIDCTKGYGKQTDGAHFTSVGSNCSLRYNLHNIHSANSQCNQYSDTHKEGYVLGLIIRYGNDYLKRVKDLKLEYPEIKLTANDVHEKLTLIRSIIRNFKTFQFENSIQARDLLNNLIGIYK